MRKSEIRSHRWPLTSGRGSLELCIEEERVTVTVHGAPGESHALHPDDLSEWADALRAGRRELARASTNRPANAFRRWTREADDLLREGTAAGMTPGELARELGRSVNAVRLRLEDAGEIPVDSA